MSFDLSLMKVLYLCLLCCVDMLIHKLYDIVDVLLHSNNAFPKGCQTHSLLLSRAF